MINGRTTCGTFGRAKFSNAKALLWNQRDWRKDLSACCSRMHRASVFLLLLLLPPLLQEHLACFDSSFAWLLELFDWLNLLCGEPHGSCLALNQRFHEQRKNVLFCLNYDSRSHYSCDHEKLGGDFKLFVLLFRLFCGSMRTPALVHYQARREAWWKFFWSYYMVTGRSVCVCFCVSVCAGACVCMYVC